jgi:hypothetical protein
MAAGSTYNPIATTTLSSASASYTFSSISGSYTDLILVMSASHSGTGVSDFIQVGNGSADTGSNYSYTGIAGSGSAASSGRSTSQTKGYLGYLATTTIYDAIIHLQNYSNTTTNKTMLVRKGQADGYVEANVILWRSTSAINTIKVFPDAGNFQAGSTFTLYGIQAA